MGWWQRPLVVGASGQVGAELCRELASGGANEVIRSAREPREGWLTLNLGAVRSPEDAAKQLGLVCPDLILCSGAMTFVDGCESRPEEAFRVNAHGPSALAAYAHSRGIPFVFFSSDYVFDGSTEHPGPYVEGDVTRPLNVYGRSKLEGERAVQRVHPEALVIRTSWVYGPDAAGKNFISSLARQLRAGQTVRVPLDQVSTPTLNGDLADVALRLAAAKARGVFHVTGPDVVSRFALAKAVAEGLSLPAEQIEGVETASLGQTAARPLRSGLRSERMASLLPGVRLHTLQEGLCLSLQALAP